MLPEGIYERVVIHDNFLALNRFAKSKGKKHLILSSLKAFNGRFIAFYIDGVSFISTCMGSAQTNCLVEALAKNGCKVIVKVGTCSALDSDLKEADIIVPCGALIDEGATYWRKVEENNDLGIYQSQKQVDRYISAKEIVSSDRQLRKRIIESVKESKQKDKLITRCQDKQFVWSVDSYDCFDRSYELWSKVNSKEYKLKNFHSRDEARVGIAGVEMECSALFASAQDLCIPAVALIIVARSRERLLYNNVPKSKWARFKISNVKPRDEQKIQVVERVSIRIAMEVVKKWK